MIKKTDHGVPGQESHSDLQETKPQTQMFSTSLVIVKPFSND